MTDQDLTAQDAIRSQIDRLTARERKLVEARISTSNDGRDFYRYARSSLGSSPDVSLLKPLLAIFFRRLPIRRPYLLITSPTSHSYLTTVPLYLISLYATCPPLAVSDIDELAVYNALRALGDKLTVTPDELPPILFSRAALGLARPLQIVNNLSLKSGIVPRAWKLSYVTPIFKSKSADVANYRPIAITVVASKILERTLADRIVSHGETQGLFDRYQFGFRHNRSTVLQLVDPRDKWLSDFNDTSARIDVIFIDFRAAFDVVNHRFLIAKLPSFGFSDLLCEWFRNFLTSRSFRVRIGSSFSKDLLCLSGVPQGSVVGNLLYLLYTTDMQY